MKKEKSIIKTINEMKKMAYRMPRTINEMMAFEGDDSDLPEDDEYTQTDEYEEEKPEIMQQDNGGEMNVEAFVDDIRKKALKGMAQLADNPEDSRYQILKKIWQICDKKPEDQQMQQKNM